jgi:hypothetical protein
MALWEPSLLMSIYNVRLTRVRVKDKACIYNDLRMRAGIDCIAGEGKGQSPNWGSMVGIELRRAGCRWRVTKPALSIASWVLISTVATFSEAPL